MHTVYCDSKPHTMKIVLSITRDTEINAEFRIKIRTDPQAGLLADTSTRARGLPKLTLSDIWFSGAP